MELNGLSPADFLRPFGDVGNLNNISFKTVDKNTPYKLSNFRVNFIDSQRMNYDSKFGEKVVAQVIDANKPSVNKSLQKTKKQSTNK